MTIITRVHSAVTEMSHAISAEIGAPAGFSASGGSFLPHEAGFWFRERGFWFHEPGFWSHEAAFCFREAAFRGESVWRRERRLRRNATHAIRRTALFTRRVAS